MGTRGRGWQRGCHSHLDGDPQRSCPGWSQRAGDKGINSVNSAVEVIELNEGLTGT